jgi:hypothetical protein
MEHAHFLALGGIVALLLLGVPLWKIFGKAGFAPAWALLILLPGIGNLAILLLLAFRRWPTTEGGDERSP